MKLPFSSASSITFIKFFLFEFTLAFVRLSRPYHDHHGLASAPFAGSKLRALLSASFLVPKLALLSGAHFAAARFLGRATLFA